MSHPHEYDNLLKYLAEHYPAALASWLLGKPVTRVKALKTELSLQPIRADAVHLLEIDDEILHVEFETDPTKSEPPLDLRMLDYFVRVYRRERKPVRQVVIVLAETGAQIPEEFHVGDTRHRYRVIRMWKQDPEPLLAHEGLWPLAVLARSEQPEQLLVEVAEKVSKIADESQRSDLTALEEGEQRGEQRGIQRGERLGRLAIIQQMLTHRFGNIPPALQEQLSALSSPELDRLSAELLSFSSIDDLGRWLEQNRASA
jgi:predicted transposase YdaD